MDKHHTYAPFCSALIDRINELNRLVADPKQADAPKELRLLNSVHSQIQKLNTLYAGPKKKQVF